MKVCHVTSVHRNDDIRVFVKECSSLAANGYDTYLVAPGEDCEQNGVHVIGVGEKPDSRIKRMTAFAKAVYNNALQLDCDIYHFHDPELLRFSWKMKRKGKCVIYDSHEDVPSQIRDKEWIPKPLRIVISEAFKIYETHIVKRIDAVVAATPHIADKFQSRAKSIVVVNNYPKFDDIIFNSRPFSERDPVICYAGGISELRGEKIMIEAMKSVNATLFIAGDHPIEKIDNKIKYIGQIDREGVNELYGKAICGLCILKPIKNYLYSQPIKMYEYMAAGIPFICSDFPGWRSVAEESGAGICVAPDNVEEIAAAIRSLLDDRKKAQRMGRMGHEYVIKNCNWKNEERSLLSLYESLQKQMVITGEN